VVILLLSWIICLFAVSVYIQRVFRNARILFNTSYRDIPRGFEMVQVCCYWCLKFLEPLLCLTTDNVTD